GRKPLKGSERKSPPSVSSASRTKHRLPPEPGKRSKVCRDKAVENGTGGEVKGKDGGIGDGASDEVPVGSKAFSRGIGLGLQIPVAPCRLPGKLYGVGKQLG